MVKIFVCYHKSDQVFCLDGYKPIHVGKNIALDDLLMDGDDTGDSISNLNPWYCELTAQYWIWKNCQDADFVGLCHYRRYLDFKPGLLSCLRPYIHSAGKYVETHASIKDFHIEKYDVIIPKLRACPIPLYDHLCQHHIKKDIDILGEIVCELYPEYKNDFDIVFRKGNHYIPCNILVARKNIYDDYSKWLFSILFELGERQTIPMNPYQPRVMGFYSERLMGVYFHHNSHYKIKSLPLLILDNGKNRNVLLVLMREKIMNLSNWLYKRLI